MVKGNLGCQLPRDTAKIVAQTRSNIELPARGAYDRAADQSGYHDPYEYRNKSQQHPTARRRW